MRAIVNDGRLVRYVPDAPVDRIFDMSVKTITSVRFGRPNLARSTVKPLLPRLPAAYRTAACSPSAVSA
ncbi:SMP-30/gluconolactonase/LRE family protein [Mesorhizobium sp. B2-1-3A]|uniref:SMP-30/gluconolactonase/LRE family protein n=1 Tax=Mesorhizobium sp. B2-1-3A TaxID=2589971 RepID=UPI001FEF8B58|nr:SMP-30/gluconolactonase/LRE family protein [Mesorhizobium sp. B2-1-3A]